MKDCIDKSREKKPCREGDLCVGLHVWEEEKEETSEVERRDVYLSMCTKQDSYDYLSDACEHTKRCELCAEEDCKL